MCFGRKKSSNPAPAPAPIEKPPEGVPTPHDRALMAEADATKAPTMGTQLGGGNTNMAGGAK